MEALPAMETLLDRAHLARQTFGDEALAAELLGLFAAQCRALGPAIADAARPAAERADLAHTLKGSALGIGAARVAALAARIEDAFRSGDAAAGEALVPPLAGAVADTLALL